MDNFSDCRFYRAFGTTISNGKHPNRFFNGSRLPTHMPLEAHQIIDEWFVKNFDVKARSSTIFVGTKFESVKKYICDDNAVVKKISFPVGSKYIFSLGIHDLYEDIDFLKQIDGYADERNIPAYLDKSKYQITCNPESIPSGFLGEIMVYCPSFLLEDA